MSESLAERARRKLAERGIPLPSANTPDTPPPAAPTMEFDPSLIPDVGPVRERSQQDLDIDRILDELGIVDAYRLWCGKSEPKIGSRSESIMVSCPQPDHPDKNPSAWLNSDKDVFHCGACQKGGDKYDLAAIRFGYAVPGYKTDGSFPDLRRDMAEGLGYRVTRTPAGQTIVTAPAADPEPEPQQEVEPAEPEPAPGPALAPVIPITPDLNAHFTEVAIDWRSIVAPNTFLARWMHVCSKDDLPEEYYFWLGMMALGLCSADDVVLQDEPVVKGNLFVCLLGSSGIGKSRSARALSVLLRDAMPYDRNDPTSTGIYQIAAPGSAEALIDYFSKPEFDPTDPSKVVGYRQVRGLLRVDELAEVMAKGQRSGSVLKPVLMQLYDGYGDIELSSRGRGYVKAERPFCSTITTTQPGAIRDLLTRSDADSGFVNRWIFAAGQPKKLVAIGREPLDIDSCVPLLRKVRAWAASPRRVALDEPAVHTWANFFEENIEPIKVSGESSLLTRSDLTFKKIMLLFAVNEMTTTINADLVDRALALWGYMEHTYTGLADQIGVGEFEDLRKAVLEFIDKWTGVHGHGPSTADLNRLLPERFNRRLLVDVLKNLETLQAVKVAADRRSGAVRYDRAG